MVVNGRSDHGAVEAVVDEINAGGGQAIGAMADVSDEAATARMVADTVAAFGGIDVLVSNAGLRRQTPFLEIESFGVARDSVGRAGRRLHPGSRGGPSYDPTRRRRDCRAIRHLHACRHAQSLSRLRLQGGP